MSVVKKNVIANFLGKGFSALLSLIFVPFYVKLLGVEAYGLIGLFVIMQSIFMLADMGLSGTFTRETARLSVIKDGAGQMRNLCRTFEVIFGVVGFLIALFIAASSGLIAKYWVNPEQLSVPTVSMTILLIGVTVGLQFPFFIYQGGLQGLQRQTLLNIFLVVLGLLRGLGAVLILMFIDTSIQTFFAWQVMTSVIQISVGRILMWRCLPDVPARPCFNLQLIRPIWRFAAGMTGITLSSILLTQMDKLILTKMLSLEMFGYYTLANLVASVPIMIAMPVNSAIYPRFTQLVAMRSFSELTGLYHRSCQVLAVPLIPVGLVLAFFSKEVMLVWTGSMVTAQNTFLLISVLVVGSTLMGLMLIPYALQLAFAWTRLSLIFNYVVIVVLVPLMIWLTALYGALGASFIWLVLNSAYVLGMIHLMHRRILPGEKWKWYVDDVGKPLFSALIIVLLGHYLISTGLSKLSLAMRLASILLASICAASMSVEPIRLRIISIVSNFGRKILNCNLRE